MICSDHFSEAQLIRGAKRVFPKIGAVPSRLIYRKLSTLDPAFPVLAVKHDHRYASTEPQTQQACFSRATVPQAPQVAHEENQGVKRDI